MIIVFGSMNIDIVMPVDHFPKPGETVLCATDYLSRAGGKGANQAVAAARAGAKVAIVGQVGDDSFGRRCTNNLKNQGIWTSGVGTSERPTGCATIAVDMNGENFIMVAPGANLDAMADQVPDEILSKKNILMTQLELPVDQTFSVMARAHALGAQTILNASPAGHIPKEVFASLNYLVVNEIEAQQLALGLNITAANPSDLARKIAQLGRFICIITMEDKGSVASNGTDIYTQAAMPVEVVDTTGAGDAFCGIFAACLHAGHNWLHALHRASIGASLSCLGLGAQAGIPFIEDIEKSASDLPGPKKIA